MFYSATYYISLGELVGEMSFMLQLEAQHKIVMILLIESFIKLCLCLYVVFILYLFCSIYVFMLII